MFHLQQSGNLRFPMVQNSCRVYQELEQADFDQLIRKKFHSIKFIYYLSAKKVTARNILLVSISSIAFVTNLTSAGFKRSDFYFLLLFLVSSQPSTTSWRSPHSSPMSIRLGNFTKFPIPSCSSSTLISLSVGLSYSSMKTWFCLKIKLECHIFEESFLHFLSYHIYLVVFLLYLRFV